MCKSDSRSLDLHIWDTKQGGLLYLIFVEGCKYAKTSGRQPLVIFFSGLFFISSFVKCFVTQKICMGTHKSIFKENSYLM